MTAGNKLAGNGKGSHPNDCGIRYENRPAASLTSGNPCSLKELLHLSCRPACWLVIVSGFPVANLNTRSEAAHHRQRPAPVALESSAAIAGTRQTCRAKCTAELRNVDRAGNRKFVVEFLRQRSSVVEKTNRLNSRAARIPPGKWNRLPAFAVVEQASDRFHVIEGKVRESRSRSGVKHFESSALQEPEGTARNAATSRPFSPRDASSHASADRTHPLVFVLQDRQSCGKAVYELRIK